MEVRKIKSTDLFTIAKEHEFFFWHFTIPRNRSLVLFPYLEPAEEGETHQLKELVDFTGIPFFESDLKEEIDFVMSNIPGAAKHAWGPKDGFRPVIVAFNRFKPILSTWNFCYCPEGISELIYHTNPKFLENLNFD